MFHISHARERKRKEFQIKFLMNVEDCEGTTHVYEEETFILNTLNSSYSRSLCIDKWPTIILFQP